MAYPDYGFDSESRSSIKCSLLPLIERLKFTLSLLSLKVTQNYSHENGTRIRGIKIQ
jgi:hypothetical protein